MCAFLIQVRLAKQPKTLIFSGLVQKSPRHHWVFAERAAPGWQRPVLHMELPWNKAKE